MENTKLIPEANHHHPSGLLVIFSVVTKYRDNLKNKDIYENANELAKRAIKEWRVFSEANYLL